MILKHDWRICTYVFLFSPTVRQESSYFVVQCVCECVGRNHLGGCYSFSSVPNALGLRCVSTWACQEKEREPTFGPGRHRMKLANSRQGGRNKRDTHRLTYRRAQVQNRWIRIHTRQIERER